jgi:hypothetical protein
MWSEPSFHIQCSVLSTLHVPVVGGRTAVTSKISVKISVIMLWVAYSLLRLPKGTHPPERPRMSIKFVVAKQTDYTCGDSGQLRRSRIGAVHTTRYVITF